MAVNFWTPRTCDGFAFDVNPELRQARPATGWNYVSSPPMFGALRSLFPLYGDYFVQANRRAKSPFGPGITTMPVNLQNQLIFPQLPKQGSA